MIHPGKFEGIADGEMRSLAEGLYAEPADDEESLGGEGYVDWYGLYLLPDGGALLLNEDNQGFVTATGFPSSSDAEDEMERLHELACELAGEGLS